MAELPEIVTFAGQMNQTLKGQTIQGFEFQQEKCLNSSPEVFASRAAGAVIEEITTKGKWFIHRLSNGQNLLLSLGMGADMLYFKSQESITGKYQIKVLLQNGTGYTVRFWWFGHYLICSDAELETEPYTCDIAPDPFSPVFTLPYFLNLLQGKKGQIKAFLLNQRNIGGIGNMYMHDILFMACLHPKRLIPTLTGTETTALYNAIQTVLKQAIANGLYDYEMDFFGNKGKQKPDDFFIGYRENRPCPHCQTPITFIKTGSTGSYICQKCQAL